MISRISFSSQLLSTDIETSSDYESFEALKKADPRKSQLWIEKHNKAIEKNKDIMFTSCNSPEESYLANASLYPEFGRIVCVSFTHLRTETNDIEDPIIFNTKSFYDKKATRDSEKEILEVISHFIDVANSKFRISLAGHNIINFDIPFLIKRFLINGVKVPNCLMIVNKKPWELDFVDTSKIWQFGSFENSATLDVLTCVLGIDSPKTTIIGKYVGRVFWQDKNYEAIKSYCEMDTIAVAEVLVKLSFNENKTIIKK